MYFFDLSDYIATASGNYSNWANDSIISGYLGLGGWRGFISGDFEDFMTTARATHNTWHKGLNEYFQASLDILKESTGSTISKLYYNEYFDAHENYLSKREIYFNSYKTSKRIYDARIIYGTFTGTYNQWLQNEIVIGNVITGTTTDDYVRVMASGGTINKTYVINYGDFNNIQFKDIYYDEFIDSMYELMRIMKTAMVLIDGDTFPDLQ